MMKGHHKRPSGCLDDIVSREIAEDKSNLRRLKFRRWFANVLFEYSFSQIFLSNIPFEHFEHSRMLLAKNFSNILFKYSNIPFRMLPLQTSVAVSDTVRRNANNAGPNLK